MEKIVNDIQKWIIAENYHNESPIEQYFKLVHEFLKAETAYRKGDKIELSEMIGSILFSMIVLCTRLGEDFNSIYDKAHRYYFLDFDCLFELGVAIQKRYSDFELNVHFDESLIELISRVIRGYQSVMKDHPTITPKILLLRRFNLIKVEL